MSTPKLKCQILRLYLVIKRNTHFLSKLLESITIENDRSM